MCKNLIVRMHGKFPRCFFSFLMIIQLPFVLLGQKGFEISINRPEYDDYFSNLVCDSLGNSYAIYQSDTAGTPGPIGTLSTIYKISPSGDTNSFFEHSANSGQIDHPLPI